MESDFFLDINIDPQEPILSIPDVFRAIGSLLETLKVNSMFFSLICHLRTLYLVDPLYSVS